jgi:hypothetical protein
MGRYNKTIDGVFVDIVGDTDQPSMYHKFVNNGNSITNPSRDLIMYTTQYKDVINSYNLVFERLAHLEEIIMQLRSVDDIQDIKLSVVREYIYARCPFYRKDKTSKDIRVIVDKVEFWPNHSVDDLINDSDFMEKSKIKLIKAMKIEVEYNLNEYNKLMEKI